MIVLKHLAREFDVEPYPLRGALRKAGLEPDEKRRWRWPDKKDENYKKAAAVAQKLRSSKLGKNTSN